MLEKKKILLIEPPFYRLFKASYSLDRYPLSLGYLGAAIKKNTEWEVMAYNADFTPESETVKVGQMAGEGFEQYLATLKNPAHVVWKEMAAVVSAFQPDVVGISVKSQNFAATRIIANIVKEYNPSTIVLVGGPHPSMVGAEVFACPDIDIAVRGEGEETIVELLDAIAQEAALHQVAGILFRREDEIVENPARNFIADLDSLSHPHQFAEEILKDYPLYPNTAFRSIFATRGCPYNCSFCGSRKIWSRRARFRSVNNVIEEIKGLRQLGLHSIHFEDDTFGIKKSYINDLCHQIITECPGLKWSCELHVNLVNEETIALMKAAGCYLISIGIESGNNEMLKKIGKNITIEEALTACEIIKRHGILLTGFFMIGFPEETEESFNDTVTAMIKSRADNIIYSIFMPYPGTEIFNFCKERGLIDDSYDITLYNHQSPANSFCLNIDPNRMRFLAAQVERMVDRTNTINKFRRVFSPTSFWKAKELGFAKALRKGAKILVGR